MFHVGEDTDCSLLGLSGYQHFRAMYGLCEDRGSTFP
jgi:hypothetical protein